MISVNLPVEPGLIRTIYFAQDYPYLLNTTWYYLNIFKNIQMYPKLPVFSQNYLVLFIFIQKYSKLFAEVRPGSLIAFLFIYHVIEAFSIQVTPQVDAELGGYLLQISLVVSADVSAVNDVGKFP